MMDFKEFVSKIYACINDFPPFLPALVDVTKADGFRCKGIVILEPDVKASADGLKASPIIYLEEYYQKYLEGQDVFNIADDIIKLYSGFTVGGIELEEQDIVHLRDYADWEAAKDHVFCQFCSAEGSAEYLKDKPYTQIDDLAATYHVHIEEFPEEGSVNSFTVDFPLLKYFGVDVETLHKTAMENTKRLFPANVESMESIFADVPMAEEGGMMDFEAYASFISGQVQSLLPGVRTHIKTVTKENDSLHKGLVINRPDAGTSPEAADVSPIIYLESYYQNYLEGQTPQKAAEEICSLYQELEKQEFKHLGTYTAWEDAKDHVFLRLCSAEGSEEYLKDKPYTRTGDIAAVCRVLVDENRAEGSVSSFPVDFKILEKFGVSAETLHKTALENTKRLFPAKIQSMESVIASAGIALEERTGMLVVSSQTGMFGAAAILDGEVQEEARQMLGGDFIILPSSVHEVLLVSKPEDGDVIRELEEMVREINASVVSPQEVLSNHVYTVDWRQHQIVPCRKQEALQISQAEGRPEHGKRQKPAGPKL